MKTKLFIKAKYIKRWKGKDGKWQYEYSAQNKEKNSIWMQTKKQYVDRMVSLNPQGIHQRSIASKFHKLSVINAIKEGKKVPANVLKDYPGLKDSVSRETVYTYEQYNKIAHENGKAHSINLLMKAYGRREKGQGTSLPIASREDFDTLYKNTTMAMISAGRNPANAVDMKLTDKQIDERTKSLENDLKAAGYVYTPAEGKYENPEKSFMVLIHDAQKEEMFELGSKYNQDSVAFADKGKNSLLMTTGKEKGKEAMAGQGYSVIDNPKDDDDFYTDAPVAGKKMRFSLMMEEIKKALRLIFNVRK
jgi:hypothetical protein